MHTILLFFYNFFLGTQVISWDHVHKVMIYIPYFNLENLASLCTSSLDDVTTGVPCTDVINANMCSIQSCVL